MKRRLLSAFLAVMMVLTMAPVAFAAGEDAENTADGSASAGTGSSEVAPAKTLQEQINGIEETGTVTLDKNYTEDITIPANKNITLNLNGKTLTNEKSDTITVVLGATLTINGAGTVDNVTHGRAPLYNNGTVELNGGKYIRSAEAANTTSSSGGNSYYNILNHGVMTINEGVEVYSSGHFSSLVANGYYDYSDTQKGDRTAYIENVGQAAPKLTINNGKFSGGINTVKNDDNATLTVNDGTFSNITQAVVQNNNIATVNGGTFDAPNYHVLENRKFNGNYNAGELTVTGGNFTGSIMVTSGATTSITGGTFSSDVSAYCEKNYYTEKNADNTYTVKSMKDVAVAKIDDTYYKTLADAVTAADNTTVTLLKDTTENVTISTDKTFTLDLNGYTLSGGKNNGNAALLNEGTVTIKDSSANKTGTIKREDNADQTGTTYYVIKNNGTMTIEQANVINNSGYEKTNAAGPMAGSSLICNGDRADDKETTLTINDGVFEQQNFLVVKNGTFGILNVNGGKFTSKHSAIQNWYKADIMGGEINGQLWTDAYTWGKEEKEYSAGVTKLSGTTKFTGEIVMDITLYTGITIGKIPTLEISGGEMNITNWRITSAAANAGAKPVVSGGYFTTNPSDYVASGYVAGTSDVSGYSYKVVAKTDTGNVEVKPAVAKPEVKVDKIPQADKEKVAAAAATVSAPTLGAAAGDIVKDIDEAKATDLVNSATEVTGDKKLYVQSSLKVEPTAYDAANKTLALEITPQYRVVASTATTANEIKLDGDNKNAQVVQKYTDMTINTPTEVTMELPAGFAVDNGAKLSIQHTKSNGVEYYTGTVTKKDDKLYLTFTTNGFSPFVISVPAASIGENVYPTLQAAADAAKSTDVISVKSGASHELNFTTTKSVKVKNDTGVAITVKFNGTNKDVAKDATETFSYTKPSSSSSGGSSSGKTIYKVTTSAVNNGGVNASPSNAEKGATITITLSPDKGYKLDKLTVTDGSGKSVSTVKKSDTVYTFTMPASAVKVGVSYVKATETPSETKFNDVSANDWFASAVDYVTGKGMMNGTAANTFSPKANTTRGMVVTVLYRLENQPSTSAASFTDVASGAYYANAVAWANANGIVSGYGSGKFGPNDKVTREQLAAILYRYAQYKKYDVSGANSLDGYTDVQSVSSYAVPALQWANAAGVVTGKSGSKLDPKGNATRAEVAAMLMRFCENVK